MSRYHILLFTFCILLFQTSVTGKPNKRIEMDSLHKAAVVQKRHVKADSIRSHVVPVVFSLGYADSLLLQIDHFHSTLNNITNESKYGFKTRQIENDLHKMESAIQVISQCLGRDSTITSINNLQLFHILLIDMEQKLHGWREVLYEDNKSLSNMSVEMNSFVQDSFTQKVAADTAFANLHLDEMIILNERWNEAQKSTTSNLTRIGKLQAAVSGSYFDVTELQNVVNNKLSSATKKIFGKEYNYIWKTQNPFSYKDVIDYTELSFNERMSTLKYYLTLNTQDWVYVIIAGFIFFIWVFWNFKKIKACTTPDNEKDLTFKYILPVPVLTSLIFILNIAPFYGFNQPAIYIEILHLLILIPLTILFLRIWPKDLFYYWCVFVVLSIVTSMANVVITPGWPLRLILIGLNLTSLVIGYGFLMAYNKNSVLGKPVKFITILYIIMNILALFTNISGRLTLTRILNASAITGITQMIGLFILVPILIEAFYIQMKSRRIATSMPLKFKYDDIQQGLYSLLAAAAIFFWFITFTTNLEIYTPLLSFLDKLLNTQRKVGSTSFSYGNILTFIFILYVVSILQKYIGYFFGETEEDFIGDLDKKESRLVIFRLVIIMVGFFIAVVASGLPVDKVTVVLGALGVGIGLGLQNIVYNLVSGVVLIFEKPMQIGDYIEVADKKGRVQNIGIRSSKLITSDGSEVIVPNGDILSSHMVNWTRSNNNRRTQLTMAIEPAAKLQEAKDNIIDELKKSKYVIQDRAVEILLNNLSEESVELSINVWINSIYKEQEFRSQILSDIYTRLASKGIKIV